MIKIHKGSRLAIDLFVYDHYFCSIYQILFYYFFCRRFYQIYINSSVYWNCIHEILDFKKIIKLIQAIQEIIIIFDK